MATETAPLLISKYVVEPAVDAFEKVKEASKETKSLAEQQKHGRAPDSKQAIAAKKMVKKANQATNKAMSAMENGADLLGKANKLNKAINTIGIASTAIEQYSKSTAQTWLGKGVDAGVAAALGTVGGPTMAVINGFDAITGNYLAEKGELKMNTSGHLSDTINDLTRATVTTAEALITGDDKGIREFHERSQNGEQGVIIGCVSTFGQRIADNNKVDKALGSAADAYYVASTWFDKHVDMDKVRDTLAPVTDPLNLTGHR